MNDKLFDKIMVVGLLVIALSTVTLGVKAMYDLQQINWSKVIAK